MYFGSETKIYLFITNLQENRLMLVYIYSSKLLDSNLTHNDLFIEATLLRQDLSMLISSQDSLTSRSMPIDHVVNGL